MFLNQKGTTVAELLIGMAILVIVLVCFYQVLNSMERAQQYTFEEAANLEEERIILNNISSEIRNTTEIALPEVGNTATTLQYKKSGDTNYRTIAIGQNDDANTVVFMDSNGSPVLRCGRGRSKQLSFIRNSAQSVTIQLTLKNATKPISPTNSISTLVYTLN